MATSDLKLALEITKVASAIRKNRRHSMRGQSLIVAVIVMFVLLFIGSIFVGIVARNLLNSGRAKDTVSAGQFAEAGIKYCDLNLQNSPLGADWRPAPVAIGNINPNDPDFNWLQRGYSRVDLNGGRALVKVTYRPNVMNDPTDPAQLRQIINPLNKYIKIEAIGRVGNINANDPTTFLNTPAPRLRREYVAYKALALTDYLRYVHNAKNDTKAEAFLGVQPFGVPVFMQLGGLPINMGTVDPTSPFANRTTGAPMQINAKLHLGPNIVLAVDRRNGEAIRVAEDIQVDSEVTGDPTRFGPRFNALEANAANADPTAPGATTPPLILPSDGLFNSFGGLLRDSAGIPDINGYVRAISRLTPPSIDVPDQATGLTRYRQLTRNSGKYLPNPNNPNSPIDLGRAGLGGGIYIENFRDVQSNTTAQGASNQYTVRDDVAHPGGTENWKGSYYIPAGEQVEFGYPVVADRDPNTSVLVPDSTSPHPGFILKRSDGAAFADLLGGNSSVAVLQFSYFIYKPQGQPPVLKVESDFYRRTLASAPFNMSEKDIDRFLPDFNGVIYAEGNLKVRGLLPSTNNIQIRRENSGEANPLTDQQIHDLISTSVTLVSGSNIYIEGSLIREEPRSMIALLAVENVIVNQTMFMAPTGGDLAFEPNLNTVVPAPVAVHTNSTPFQLDFQFGENPAAYVDQSNNNVPIQLLLRHGAAKDKPTFLNLLINKWAPHTVGTPGTGPQPSYWFSYTDPTDPTLPAWTLPLKSPGPDALQNDAWRLLGKRGDTNNPYLFTGDTGYTWPQGFSNRLEFSVDVSHVNAAGPNDYLLGRAAVVPMDVRIEAVMFAQNGSFLMTSGYPLNNDIGGDSREQAMRNAVLLNAAAPLGSVSRYDSTNPLFPFAGEPIDCRITIIGAISENTTASAAEQTEWMRLWGWIPQTYGSTGKDLKNSGAALEIPKAHLFVNDATATGGAVMDMRFDAEKNAALGDPNNKVGITRGIRFIYDPALAMPYAGYAPKNMAFRADLANFDPTNPIPDPDRTLPPVPRLPVCPGFVFNGEVR